jgi:hypothetical protein
MLIRMLVAAMILARQTVVSERKRMMRERGNYCPYRQEQSSRKLKTTLDSLDDGTHSLYNWSEHLCGHSSMSLKKRQAPPAKTTTQNEASA